MALSFNILAPSKDKYITRKIGIYGPSGAGKTHFAGTAQDVPEMADAVLGSIDGGEGTLTSRGDILSTVTRKVSDVEELLWLLAKKDAAVKNVRTLILDGGSEMQKKDLADIALKAAADKPGERDKDLNQLQDYKLNKGKMLRILRFARDIPDINLIVTFWANFEYPTAANGLPATNMPPTRIEPDLSKSVAKVAIGYFDDFYYLEKSKNSEQRILYTGEMKNAFAKCRDQVVAEVMSTTNAEGKTLPYILNPTFPDIYARYKKAYKIV